MGNVCSSVDEADPISFPDNERVHMNGDELEDRAGEIYMICAGIDYSCDTKSWAGPPPNGHGPLDTKYAFDMIASLVESCEDVKVLKKMFNTDCTKENLAAAIQEVASQAGPNDYFVFYYTGHGDRLPQDDAGEEEEMDNCLCTVGPDGCTDDALMQYRNQVWWRDDDLAQAIVSSVNPDVQVICLFDCCHSGSMCDFGPDTPWAQKGIKAISISGCQDKETSAGTGKGGMFSRAMSKAIEQIMEEEGEEENFCMGCLYNKILDIYKDNKLAGHTQNITINSTGVRPKDVACPFQPEGYQCPFRDVMDLPGEWADSCDTR